MNFKENQIYHIYNQGNNKRQLFYSDNNYVYFLWKMKAYLLPFGEMVSWCLMPNHFHWQFYVKKVFISKDEFIKHKSEIELERRFEKYGVNTEFKPTVKVDNPDQTKMVSLNDAIGILQQSYTKAINKRMGWTGSLFKGSCKAKDGFSQDFLWHEKVDRNSIYHFDAKRNYAFRCFQYIHDNPKIAGLIDENEDWKWSSAQDYKYNLSTSICNLELGNQICEEI